MNENRYDVVVIGGGPAGLSAAVALARSRRTVLVADSGDPRNAPAAHVHNYLGREGTPPGDLLAAGRAEVAGYGGEIVTGTVTSAQRLDDAREDGARFRIVLADGEPALTGGVLTRGALTRGALTRGVLARRLLVTTGLADELPDVPGVADRWGRDVLHCPYCHGWEVRDQVIAVLASGPGAVHQALLFRQLSEHVTVLLNTAPELGGDVREQLDARGIAVVEGEVATLEVTGDRLTGVRLRSGQVVPCQAVVVQPRFTARAGVLSSLGLEPTDMEMGGQVVGSYVPAGPAGDTAVPGVWVAGNVADLKAQVISSAAAGLNAAAAINADLVEEDARVAVAARRALV
jgi:thioredoxin reductase (NADPH)